MHVLRHGIPALFHFCSTLREKKKVIVPSFRVSEFCILAIPDQTYAKTASPVGESSHAGILSTQYFQLLTH